MNKENNVFLSLLLQEGEGYKVKFKERIAHIDREIVAFANSAGGSIFVGISDNNYIKGIDITNKLKSEIFDIARNCDPNIQIELITHANNRVLEIKIFEGIDKPYKCTEGFFLRTGPTSQKLKRDEILQLIQDSHRINFDETLNYVFNYPEDFSSEALQIFLKQANITTALPNEDVLISLSVAKKVQDKFLLTNAGILFFAKNPQQFFPEAYITLVKYLGRDRFSILDNQSIRGNLITQIDQSMDFVRRHMSSSAEFSVELHKASRVDRYDYPPLALREVIVNAIAHRDYLYDASHIYIHLYQDRIEIENPGGLYKGLTLENLGKRSVRRNRLIADLLHHARYIEKIGSGFDRMKAALTENNNPPFEVSVTNFFDIRFYKRIAEINLSLLSSRQIVLWDLMKERKTISKKEVASILTVSEDTALRDLKALITLKLILKTGKGKTTTYTLPP